MVGYRFLASASLSALPFSIPCHFDMHPRQQVAVACWAMKTGCPLIGVCLPSFYGQGHRHPAYPRSVPPILIQPHHLHLSCNAKKSFQNPICSVTYAAGNCQHNSRAAERSVFKFPDKKAGCGGSEYSADNF
jgi:hypothetical protein